MAVDTESGGGGNCCIRIVNIIVVASTAGHADSLMHSVGGSLAIAGVALYAKKGATYIVQKGGLVDSSPLEVLHAARG